MAESFLFQYLAQSPEKKGKWGKNCDRMKGRK